MWEANVECLHSCGQKAIVVHQTASTFGGVSSGTHMGLGNAQRAEVQFLMDQNIPFYLYSIEEYEELIAMARDGRDVPEERRGSFSIADGLTLVHNISRASGEANPLLSANPIV